MKTARTVLKNTTVLFAAEGLSSAINVGYVAVLARYIHVAGMGEISTAQAMASTLIVLVSFGFSQLIIREMAATPSRASALVTNVVAMRLALAAGYCVFIWLVIRSAHYQPELAAMVYLYTVNAILGTLVNVSFTIFQAFEQMQWVLLVGVLKDILGAILGLVVILLHKSLLAIVEVSVLASALQICVAYFVVRHRFAIAGRLSIGCCARSCSWPRSRLRRFRSIISQPIR